MRTLFNLSILLLSLASCKKEEEHTYTYTINGVQSNSSDPKKYDVKYLNEDGTEVSLLNIPAGTVYEFTSSSDIKKKISGMPRFEGTCDVTILKDGKAIATGHLDAGVYNQWATAEF